MSLFSSHKNDQRKFKNLLVVPKDQVSLLVNIVILTLFFAVASCLMVYFQLNQIFNKLLQLSYMDDNISRMLTDQWTVVIQWLIMFVVLYLCAMTLLLLISTHRMLGPGVAFQNHLKALLSGDYKARITLRKKDSFQNLAKLFNEVTAKLEQEGITSKDEDTTQGVSIIRQAERGTGKERKREATRKEKNQKKKKNKG